MTVAKELFWDRAMILFPNTAALAATPGSLGGNRLSHLTNLTLSIRRWRIAPGYVSLQRGFILQTGESDRVLLVPWPSWPCAPSWAVRPRYIAACPKGHPDHVRTRAGRPWHGFGGFLSRVSPTIHEVVPSTGEQGGGGWKHQELTACQDGRRIPPCKRRCCSVL